MHQPLEGVGDGEEDAAALRGGLGRHRHGEVTVEGIGEEGTGQTAHVGVRAEAVGGVTLVAGDEGDGGGERDANQLRQVQLYLGTTLWWGGGEGRGGGMA